MELLDFKAAGLRWRRGEDGSYSAEERGRFRFLLAVERIDYPQYSQDSWVLTVEGLGVFGELRARFAPDGRYFGSLVSAFDLIDDYRAAARAARREPDPVALVEAEIDKVYARARAASARIRALSDKGFARQAEKQDAADGD